MESEKGIFHENRDPISNAPGAHPIGTGIGAAGAGATGMAIGAAVGPLGALIGATVGSVVGGLLGKGIAEVIDPTAEEAYWRDKDPELADSQEEQNYYARESRFGWEDNHTEVKDAWSRVEHERLNTARETLADHEANERLPRSGGNISLR